MKSFFYRVTRYPPTPFLDPRENRLTEAFAAVLEQIPGLAAEFVSDWTKDRVGDDVPCHIATQRPTASGKYVDLEISIGDAAAPTRLVWVEVKHGAGLHDSQIENYEADIAALGLAGSNRHVVLLAPRQSMPTAPPHTIKVEWQRVGRMLEDWGQRIDSGLVSEWLLREFNRFLKEERLSDHDALTAADVFSFAARPAADRAMAGVIEIADRHVNEHWGPTLKYAKKGGSTKNYGPGWWAQHALAAVDGSAATTWRDSKFEWTFRPDTASANSRDAFVFFAGATILSADSPFKEATNSEWLAALQTGGFERLQDEYWRLWRRRYPEALLTHENVVAQGKALGEWVVTAFDDLARQPPPS